MSCDTCLKKFSIFAQWGAQAGTLKCWKCLKFKISNFHFKHFYKSKINNNFSILHCTKCKIQFRHTSSLHCSPCVPLCSTCRKQGDIPVSMESQSGDFDFKNFLHCEKLKLFYDHHDNMITSHSAVDNHSVNNNAYNLNISNYNALVDDKKLELFHKNIFQMQPDLSVYNFNCVQQVNVNEIFKFNFTIL